VTERPFVPRRPPDDRPSYPRPPYRGPAPGGRPAAEATPTPTSVRIRDGEREIEVSGTAPFVRQVLDDLPVLLARLRGETPPTPAAIRMPPPSPEVARAAVPPAVEATAVAAVAPSPAPHAVTTDGNGTELEARVMATLRSSRHPLAVAGIRDRLGLEVTGQQVRRILERAGSKVVATGDRPIRYHMR